MKTNNFKKYILFWFSQAVSQLGSAMTAFSLTLWTYEKTQSAFAVSMLTFCTWLPYVAVSIFAGNFVDNHSKKRVMLWSDSIAAACSLTVLLMTAGGFLQVWHIYAVNFLIGLMNAVQSPAQSAAIGHLVPEEKLSQASGMDSFAGNLVMITAPVLAASLAAFGGIRLVIALDLASFLFAFCVLLFAIRIEEQLNAEKEKKAVFAGFSEGMGFLKENTGILYLMVTMSLINFFSRLTYENIMTPMVLARSGQSSSAVGIVNAAIGAAGIAGGLLVTLDKRKHNPVRMIYGCAALSFLCGDLLMGTGRSTLSWCIAGIAASLPIPYIMAGQRLAIYRKVPQEMYGRIFAVRNAIQYCTIPFAILMGGALADTVFEPFMASGAEAALALSILTGTGPGSGMAVMFLCTGICGFLSSVWGYSRKPIRRLEKELEEERL